MILSYLMLNNYVVMEKSRCIAIGCPMYRKSSKAIIKNGLVDCMPRYMCGRYCCEISKVVSCDKLDKGI